MWIRGWTRGTGNNHHWWRFGQKHDIVWACTGARPKVPVLSFTQNQLNLRTCPGPDWRPSLDISNCYKAPGLTTSGSILTRLQLTPGFRICRCCHILFTIDWYWSGNLSIVSKHCGRAIQKASLSRQTLLPPQDAEKGHEETVWLSPPSGTTAKLLQSQKEDTIALTLAESDRPTTGGEFGAWGECWGCTVLHWKHTA